MSLKDYIIAVFYLIDDLYKEFIKSHKIRNAGFAPLIHDSEIITMLIVGETLSIVDNSKICL